jgi:hypothetical protein
MRVETMTMQQQLFLQALDPTMKDIIDLTMKPAALASVMDGAHNGTSKPEYNSHEETSSDLHKLETSSLLMEDVGEIDIDEEDAEDCVGFHPVDTASIFRETEADGKTPLSRPICKAVSISQDFDSWTSHGDEEVIAPLPMQQRLPTCDQGMNHASNRCEASQVTNMSPCPFSVSSLLTELREGIASSPPTDFLSVNVFHPFSSSAETTNNKSALSLIAIKACSDSEDTISTTSGKHDLDDPMLALQQHERKRHKACSLPQHPKTEREEEGKAMKMVGRSDQCSLFKELLPCGTPATGHHGGHHHHHHPSLLEIAVEYGYHLARCRMMTTMNETDNAESPSGILDPSRRAQGILEDGAQTVVRMNDQERLLFWSYMS